MPKHLKPLVPCLAFVWVCFVQGIGYGLPLSAQKKSTGDPTQEAAIIEEMVTSVRFENDGSKQEMVRQRVKIQNEAGLKLYGIITFTFTTGQEFSIDTVEVHKKDGSTVKAGPDNTQEVTPEISRLAPVYSDLRQKQVTVPGLAVGDEVVFQYSTKQTALVPNQFWHRYSFERRSIVLSESVEIDVPKDRKVQISYQPECKPVITESGDRTIYRWHGSNEKLVEADKKTNTQEQEGDAPPPSIELSTFDSWEQVGAWYYALQRERATPGPAVKAKALELTKGIEAPEAKIRALYQFVSTKFRYISLDFGIGRYQPHAAEQVLANGYGDCKDKHTLLAALLEAVGIQAYPALIDIYRKVDPRVPSPGQFDHLITAVPSGKDIVFLDTTPEVAPYGLLVAPLRHKQALVLTGPSTIQFVETPASLPFSAQETFDLKGKIDDAGTMEADVSYFMHGEPEVFFKNAFRQAPPSKHKDIVQVISLRFGFGGEVSGVEVSGLDDLNGGLRLHYHYHRENYLDLHEQPPKNTLPLAAMNLPEWGDKEDSVHLYSSPVQLNYSCRVELPVGVKVQAPLEVKLERDYARYQSSYAAEGNVLSGERKMTVLVPEAAGSHRPDYEAFRRAIESDESQQIVLRLPVGFVAKSARVSSENLDEIMRRAEIEARENDFQDAYSDFRKVADLDPSHKGVWKEMGMTEARLGRYQEATKDLLKAVALDPFDAEAHAQLAAIYFTISQYEAGIAEAKKAEEIDPLLHVAHYLLGWYYSAIKIDYAAALPELEKALATEADGFNDEAQNRRFLATAYFQTKQPNKALDLLKKQVEASPTAAAWNNAAYLLAENGFELDLARQYADLALKEIYQKLDQLQPESVRMEDLISGSQLTSFWDTKGWILFKTGDAAAAEKYVRASWILSQNRTVGEHLGEIYQKLGRTQEAIRYYAMSSQEFFMTKAGVPDVSRDHLIKLLGRPGAEQAIAQHRNEPSQLRTIHLGKVAPAESKGEFSFVFGPGPKLVAVRADRGDEVLTEALRKQADRLAASVLFPEAAPQKLLRRGLVMCTRYSNSCDLVFYTNEVTTTNVTLDAPPRPQP